MPNFSRQNPKPKKEWSLRHLTHIWSNYLVVYNSTAFILSVYVLTHAFYEAFYHQDALTHLYSKHDSPIRFPFMVLELSIGVECLHVWFGIQKFSERVLINWLINLFVLFCVLSVIPEVSSS